MIRYRPWCKNGPSTTSSLTYRYLTRPVEASAHCICRARCRKAAVESCQLALHPPPPIRYNASLCTTTRCSAQLPVLDQIYWLLSDPVGMGVCRMLQTDFREFPFHALEALPSLNPRG